MGGGHTVFVSTRVGIWDVLHARLGYYGLPIRVFFLVISVVPCQFPGLVRVARLASRTRSDAELIQLFLKELLTRRIAITCVFTEATVVGIALGRGLGIMAMPLFRFVVLIFLLFCKTVGRSIVVMHGAR
jgi:hypothetical protein